MAFQLSPTARDLIRSGLFGKDFETYRSEIIDFLNARFGSEVATNIVASEQGVMLIEMVSFALSTASFYGDRQADDTTLRDARLRVAAVTIARQLGYKPAASVPPVVTLTMTITSPPVLPVTLTIPKGTALNGPSGAPWETAQVTIFNVGGSLTQTIPVRAGQSLEEIFTSDGTPNQVFELSTIPTTFSIAQSSASVTVGGVIWPEVEFLTYDQTNQVEIDYGFNPPRVVFGDGIAGNIPPANAEIRVDYFATPGTAGAVPSNSVTNFTVPIIAGTTVITSTLVHNSPSTPGSDPETIEKIKAVAPLVFAAAKRAVTLNDLDGWINSFVDPIFGAVSKGRATTPRSVAADAEALTIIGEITSLGNQLITFDPSSTGAAASVTTRLTNYWNKVLSSNCKANVIIAQILSSDSIGRYVPAPVGLAQALEGFLDTIVISTAKVKATDGSINLLTVDLTVGINLQPNYTSPVAQATVTDTIRSILQAQLIGRDYGDSLRIADLYSLVQGVQGVSYAHITVTVTDNTSTDVTAARVNSFGDVPLQDFEVITLGNLPNVVII